jgi:LmbE family N-acetylglucosaminyl deacetylase
VRPEGVDILVFAPHPDDEVIGTGGIIQQALASRRSVRVAFSTSGDGYPRAAAALAGKNLGELDPDDFIALGATRRAEALSAARELGLRESDLVHLGFPDGSFNRVLEATGGTPVESPLTRLAKSPTTGALYTRAAAITAFAEVLADSRPREVYTTHPADEHADHRATYRAVAEAMSRVGSKARLLTFLVHAGGDRWPDPNPVYETKEIDGVVYPKGVAWPPPIRTPITPQEAEAKRHALKKHASQWQLDGEYLQTFVKTEEVFWP